VRLRAGRVPTPGRARRPGSCLAPAQRRVILALESRGRTRSCSRRRPKHPTVVSGVRSAETAYSDACGGSKQRERRELFERLQAQITRIVDSMGVLERERRAHLDSIASKGSARPRASSSYGRTKTHRFSATGPADHRNEQLGMPLCFVFLNGATASPRCRWAHSSSARTRRSPGCLTHRAVGTRAVSRPQRGRPGRSPERDRTDSPRPDRRRGREAAKGARARWDPFDIQSATGPAFARETEAAPAKRRR